jgi:hypothetical protein
MKAVLALTLCAVAVVARASVARGVQEVLEFEEPAQGALLGAIGPCALEQAHAAPGAFGAPRTGGDELREAADMLEAVGAPERAAQLLGHAAPGQTKVVATSTQVVAGTNYKVWFTAGQDSYFEAIVFRPLPYAQKCGRPPCYQLSHLRQCTP